MYLVLNDEGGAVKKSRCKHPEIKFTELALLKIFFSNFLQIVFVVVKIKHCLLLRDS